jgi:hypothetical protein
MSRESSGPTNDNLTYLKDQRICERLESMVRNVLLARPEDPVLAMCNYLNDANRSGTSVRYAAASQGSLRRSQNTPIDASRPAASSSNAQPSEAAAVERNPSSPFMVVTQPLPASAGSRRETAAGSPTGTARHAQPFPESRRGSALAAPSRAGSAAVQLHRIERDESARSEVSAFSVTSVDMAEFLSDFRAAHFSLFGTSESDMTIDDLADVVDRVALPIPDTRLLSDLFYEMEAVQGTGTVPFSAFLARMSYRIASKYHIDVVRNIFFVLVKASSLDSAAMEALEKRLESVDDLAALVEEDFAVRSAATTSAGASNVTSPHAIAAGLPGKGATAVMSAAAKPAAQGGSLACATITVGLKELGDATLRGIGLRVTLREAEELLGRIGLQVSEGPAIALHVLDLARFLSLATNAASSHNAAASCSVHNVPSVGADLNELSACERE